MRTIRNLWRSTDPGCALSPHGLFLKLHNLSNRQDAKVAKTNKIDVFACGDPTSGKLGVLGVLAVKNAAYVKLQEKTMASGPAGPLLGFSEFIRL